MNNWPLVTFITPVLNEEKNMRRCLSAVKMQNYPSEKMEVLVVDGGSEDSTPEIARRMGAVVLKNPLKKAEYGKAEGLKAAEGEMVVLLDADNVIASSSWLKKMVRPLLEDDDLFGMESFYLRAVDFNALNRYVALLHIADPLARAFSPPFRCEEEKGYFKYEIDPEKGVPPMGANGFIWRKEVIDRFWDRGEKFEESNFAAKVVKSGRHYFGRVPGEGIYHYYVQSLAGFLRKRAKIAGKFLERKKEGNETWVETSSPFRFLGAVLFCASFVGPLLEGLRNSFRDRDASWLLHPVCCFLTVAVYTFYFLKHKFKRCRY